ncbi:MAG: flavin reductase [Lactococcus lactis]|jgi:flavin reductase (DIM6/NTAB) family NADH-FMN oxidoreductase RutF|nr:flavin reductase [Lactococcus lactis]
MRQLLLIIPFLMFIACNNKTQQKETSAYSAETIVNLTFDELFVEIEATDISENVFKLWGQDNTVITAGNESYFNSMTAAYGGFGIQFNLPSTWCFLRASRYTLDFIRGEQTYTMCWFDDDYKDAVLYFGSMSGRDSDKMANNPLNSTSTPDGNIAYKEAKLILECKLMQITTVSPDDFYYQKGKEFVDAGFEDAQDYHKIVFGEITKVWKKL